MKKAHDIGLIIGEDVCIDQSRDFLLSDFSIATLRDRYLLPGESIQGLFLRVATAYADNKEHAQRLYEYMSNLWFIPATPILANAGTKRGLPISCYLNEPDEDSMDAITNLWNENIALASKGGGIGTYFSAIRSIGEKIGNIGKTSGVIPFIKVIDSLTLAISQGSLRRGSTVIYMDITHPEIEEFIEIRKFQGGDPNRKAQNLHNAVCVPDAFIDAVFNNDSWNLISPKDNKVLRTVSARALWIKILTTRLETGEPYILFTDKVNNNRPLHHKLAGLKVKASNLCSEIVLPTGKDHKGAYRTAVCVLSSLNLELYQSWCDHPTIIEDIMRFLDNVLTYYINNAPDVMHKARYSAARERSIGLGVMGFHSFLQKNNVPFESVIAKSWNKKIFASIKEKVDRASYVLAMERGACPDAEEFGIMERFSYKLAIAPTASISIIADTSPSIEPYLANSFTHKTLSGSFAVKNKHLVKILENMNKNTHDVWASINFANGSVQHLDFLDEHQKMVFKTALEINQLWVIEHASERQPYICQAQSLNLFFPSDVSKEELLGVHMKAARSNIKSLYYCRSMSMGRPDNEERSKEECLACQ